MSCTGVPVKDLSLDNLTVCKGITSRSATIQNLTVSNLTISNSETVPETPTCIIKVPGDFDTIQEALDFVEEKNTFIGIELCALQYPESITVRSFSVISSSSFSRILGNVVINEGAFLLLKNVAVVASSGVAVQANGSFDVFNSDIETRDASAIVVNGTGRFNCRRSGCSLENDSATNPTLLIDTPAVTFNELNNVTLRNLNKTTGICLSLQNSGSVEMAHSDLEGRIFSLSNEPARITHSKIGQTGQITVGDGINPANLEVYFCQVNSTTDPFVTTNAFSNFQYGALLSTTGNVTAGGAGVNTSISLIP